MLFDPLVGGYFLHLLEQVVVVLVLVLDGRIDFKELHLIVEAWGYAHCILGLMFRLLDGHRYFADKGIPGGVIFHLVLDAEDVVEFLILLFLAVLDLRGFPLELVESVFDFAEEVLHILNCTSRFCFFY